MFKKLIFNSIIIACCTVLVILFSCKPKEQKVDDAYKIVKKEKMLSNDSDVIDNAMFQEPVKTQLVKTNENMDEWTIFKIETEKKILTNEKKIKEIKDIPNTNANLLRKVSNLEKSNNELRNQMNDFNEEVKLKWETFKSTINHDVNEINIELKNLSINNKK